MLKGSIKNLILAVLTEGELYGYQIVKEIEGRSKDTLQFGEGSVYPALHALEKEKLLSSHWVSQKSGPDRKYYQITEKGRKKLKSAKKEWEDFSLAIDSVLRGKPSHFYV